MIKRDEDKIKVLIHKLGLKYNLTDDVIRKIVSSPFKFTKETIRQLELKNCTEESFNEMEVNFLYKYLGKLYTSYPFIERIRKQRETQLNNLNKRWKK